MIPGHHYAVEFYENVPVFVFLIVWVWENKVRQQLREKECNESIDQEHSSGALEVSLLGYYLNRILNFVEEYLSVDLHTFHSEKSIIEHREYKIIINSVVHDSPSILDLLGQLLLIVCYYGVKINK